MSVPRTVLKALRLPSKPNTESLLTESRLDSSRSNFDNPVYRSIRGNRVLFCQRTDSTAPVVLGKHRQRVRVMDVCRTLPGPKPLRAETDSRRVNLNRMKAFNKIYADTAAMIDFAEIP